MSKPKDLQLTDHHIVPSSRGGRNGADNIKRAPHSYHDSYHHLFANLTPAEIYDYLDEVWFNPNRSFIKPEQWLEEQSD